MMLPVELRVWFLHMKLSTIPHCTSPISLSCQNLFRWHFEKGHKLNSFLVLVYQCVGVHVSTVSSQCAHEFNNLVSVPHQHMALELLWVTSLVVVALFTSWIYARDHTETEGHLQTHVVDQRSASSGCVWWWFNIIKKVIATRLVCFCVCVSVKNKHGNSHDGSFFP